MGKQLPHLWVKGIHLTKPQKSGKKTISNKGKKLPVPIVVSLKEARIGVLVKELVEQPTQSLLKTAGTMEVDVKKIAQELDRLRKPKFKWMQKEREILRKKLDENICTRVAIQRILIARVKGPPIAEMPPKSRNIF